MYNIGLSHWLNQVEYTLLPMYVRSYRAHVYKCHRLMFSVAFNWKTTIVRLYSSQKSLEA